jgi:hypothetical protein
VLLAREPFLLRGGDDLSVTHQTGGAVVVKGGEAQNIYRAFPGGRGNWDVNLYETWFSDRNLPA